MQQDNSELPKCPECGAACLVTHDIIHGDTDFGWSIGCGRYKNNDNIHSEKMEFYGFATKEKAVKYWKTFVERWGIKPPQNVEKLRINDKPQRKNENVCPKCGTRWAWTRLRRRSMSKNGFVIIECLSCKERFEVRS